MKKKKAYVAATAHLEMCIRDSLYIRLKAVYLLPSNSAEAKMSDGIMKTFIFLAPAFSHIFMTHSSAPVSYTHRLGN